jgi:hypothetical protein
MEELWTQEVILGSFGVSGEQANSDSPHFVRFMAE